MARMSLSTHEMPAPIPYRGHQSGGSPPDIGEGAPMNVQSVALRALWHRGALAAVVAVVATLVTVATARPAASASR
jgi:hypothetical protein